MSEMPWEEMRIALLYKLENNIFAATRPPAIFALHKFVFVTFIEASICKDYSI